METRYAARQDWPVERLVESLSALLTVRRRPIARQRITFLDTPDGRIGRAGASLTVTTDAGGKHIEWRHGNQRVGCMFGGPVQFAWDLPQGSLRQRIEPIVEMRRLLPLAEAEQDGALLEVMDDTRKTIARLHIVGGRARVPKRRSPWQTLRPYLTLNALRGYDRQCAAPIAIIESRPGIERSNLALQGHVLRAIGASPPQDASAYRIELDPAERADVGTLRMHRELLRIVEASHASVLAGLDSECLHDFRIGVRRTRTLLGQLKSVLPPAEIEHLDTELAWLGRICGPARDLDVLLLGLRAAPDTLSADRHHAILAHLEDERASAQQALHEELRSERFRRLIARWQASLVRSDGLPAGEASDALPLTASVSQQGWWLYRRTLSDIEHVSSDTPAQDLHRIRIHVRDLRHLIDAAASLYDPADLATVLDTLERLQTVLGEFHDACVQADWLRRYAGALDQSRRDAGLLHEAAQTLAQSAERRAEKLRKPTNQQLLRFGASANRAAFERIFHIKHLTELVQ